MTRGVGADAYIPQGARDGVLTTKDPVIITEGIKKALKAVQEGILTIALLGVRMFKVKGEQRLVPGLEQVDWVDRRVTIVFDSDGHTKRGVREAAAALAELLTAEGAKVNVMFLPEGDGRAKIGLDDYLLTHTAEDVQALIDDAGPAESVEDARRREAAGVDPETLAEVVAEARAVGGVLGDRHWNGTWYEWRGNRFVAVPDDAYRSTVLRTLKPQFVGIKTAVVSNTLMHVGADSHLDGRVEDGDWIVGDAPAGFERGADLFAAADGLVDLAEYVAGRDCVVDHTPRRFALSASPVRFDPSAPRPDRWLKFLNAELFPGRPEEARLLRQFAGYCLTTDMRHHKSLLMIGPPRSGKGTILWALGELLGRDAVAAEKLQNLSRQFALSGLIGKRLLAIGDVRMPPTRSARAAPVETLLSLTGKDAVQIDRKNKDIITARLPVKVAMATNEIPVLPDASGAVASRFLPVQFTASFLRKEDTGLKDALRTELPGILLWAIAGWQDLRDAGRFVEPAAADRMREDMEALASPVKAFVRDRCVLGPNELVTAHTFRERLNLWLGDRGQPVLDESEIGRQLKAAHPHVVAKQKQAPPQYPGGSDKPLHYFGIGLI